MRALINKVILCFCLLIALAPCFVALAAIETVSPSADFYVLDEASVLSESAEAHIVFNGDKLYKASGAQIVIVALKDHGHTSLNDYALQLYNNWEIGDSKSHGVLVLMDIGQDDYYITIGRGLERNLTGGDTAEMQERYLEPFFAKKQYEQGAIALYDALFNRISEILNANIVAEDVTGEYAAFLQSLDTRISGNTGYGSNSNDSSYIVSAAFEILLAIIIVIVVLVISSRLRRGFGGYRSAPRRGGFGGFLGGYMMGRNSSRRNNRRPPPPGGFGGFGGFGGGGGSSSGRSSSGRSSGGGFGGGGGRSSGGGFGGGRSGGGGSSRGAGSGRGR